jgi:hypothetical protein
MHQAGQPEDLAGVDNVLEVGCVAHEITWPICGRRLFWISPPTGRFTISRMLGMFFKSNRPLVEKLCCSA